MAELVEAAARGLATGGATRHVAAAAISAAIRTVQGQNQNQPEGSDEEIQNRANVQHAALAAHKALNQISGCQHHNLGVATREARKTGRLDASDQQWLQNLRRKANAARHVWCKKEANSNSNKDAQTESEKSGLAVQTDAIVNEKVEMATQTDPTVDMAQQAEAEQTGAKITKCEIAVQTDPTVGILKAGCTRRVPALRRGRARRKQRRADAERLSENWGGAEDGGCTSCDEAEDCGGRTCAEQGPGTQGPLALFIAQFGFSEAVVKELRLVPLELQHRFLNAIRNVQTAEEKPQVKFIDEGATNTSESDHSEDSERDASCEEAEDCGDDVRAEEGWESGDPMAMFIAQYGFTDTVLQELRALPLDLQHRVMDTCRQGQVTMSRNAQVQRRTFEAGKLHDG